MNVDTNAKLVDALKQHGPSYVTESFVGSLVEAGKGAELTLDDGRTILDLASGNFGYGVSQVRDAVFAQMEKLPLSNRVLVSRNLANLVFRLDQLCPDPLSVSYVCNSGEEAFDGALKLSKGYHPERNKVVVVSDSRLGTLSYGTYCSELGHLYLDALSLRVLKVAADDLHALSEAVDGNTLAVVYEPVLTVHGVKRLAPAYLMAIRDCCDIHDCLMLAYEVKTGLGVTGQRLASEFASVVPDIVVLGGALSGGQVSIGAYVTRKKINDVVYAKKNPSLHGSTTGGNPASCVAACAVLDYIREHKPEQRHREFETYLKEKLTDMIDRSNGLLLPAAQVAGSLAAVRVCDTQTARTLWALCMKVGLLLQRPDQEWLHFRPPLVISKSELDLALARFSSALQLLANDRIREVG